MYSDQELMRVGLHKAALRRRITRQRTACTTAVTRLAQPVAWIDRMLTLGRRYAPLAPFAAIPLALLFKRTPGPRVGLLGNMLRWGPVLFGTVRGLAAARSTPGRG